MIQPVTYTARALSRGFSVGRYALRCCAAGPSLLQGDVRRKKPLGVSRRQFHHATEKNVITSNHHDIVFPNCNVSDYVWMDMEKWADKTAVVCGVTGRGYTYIQAYKMTMAFAACLRNKLNLKDGDCVAIMLPNSPEFPLATLGSIQAGCIVTTVNPIYVADEIMRQLKSSKAKVVITTKDCYPETKKAIDALQKSLPIILTETNGSPLPEGTISFSEFAESFNESTECLKEVNRTADDTVFLPYSSGTTGLPKGVELTHRNIVSNCLQMLAGKVSIMQPAYGSHQDVSICVLPFFHIYGLTVTLLSKLSLGVKLVTIPKFTPDNFLNAQAKYKANVLFLVPPIVLFLSSHADVTREHLDSIKTVMSGAAPLAASDVNRFLERAKTDVAFMQGYGLTETSPVVLLQERGCSNYASVGNPAPNTDCKIVDLDNEKHVLGPNQVGELWIRGPQVMKGYYENPEANADIFREGSWMRTGDLVYYDEDESFYITDRLKELIKVKGYQVAPAELEGVLRSHPELADAAVIGVPHEHYGETPKAFVVKKDGHSPTTEKIKEFVASKVASYKKLGDVMFVDAIPKNAAGKILRREVRSKFS